MAVRKAFGLVAFLRATPERPDLVNPEKAKDSVVTISAVLLCEETEEKEYVTDANSLPCQVPLGGAGLAKGAPAVVKHRVLMAEVFRA